MYNLRKILVSIMVLVFCLVSFAFCSFTADTAQVPLLDKGKEIGKVTVKYEGDMQFVTVASLFKALGLKAEPSDNNGLFATDNLRRTVRFFSGTKVVYTLGKFMIAPKEVEYTKPHLWCEATTALNACQKFLVANGRAVSLSLGAVTGANGSAGDKKIPAATTEPNKQVVQLPKAEPAEKKQEEAPRTGASSAEAISRAMDNKPTVTVGAQSQSGNAGLANEVKQAIEQKSEPSTSGKNRETATKKNTIKTMPSSSAYKNQGIVEQKPLVSPAVTEAYKEKLFAAAAQRSKDSKRNSGETVEIPKDGTYTTKGGAVQIPKDDPNAPISAPIQVPRDESNIPVESSTPIRSIPSTMTPSVAPAEAPVATPKPEPAKPAPQKKNDQSKIKIDPSKELASVLPLPASVATTAQKRIVVLDAGHGGKDPGAMANNVKEKDIVLKAVMELADILRAQGIDVRFTRTTDVYLKLSERTAIANKNNADVFVSLHCNSLAKKNANVSGLEYYIMALPRDKDSMALAVAENKELAGGDTTSSTPSPVMDKKTKVLLQILGDMQQNDKISESTDFAEYLYNSSIASGLKMRKVAQAPFFVLRGAAMPAVLVELGYLTNRQEAQKLTTAEYRQTLCKTIAKGIVDYLRDHPMNTN